MSITPPSPSPIEPVPPMPPTPGEPPAASPSQPMPLVPGDPAGVWQRFLTINGQQPSPEEVQLFVQGLLKFFNVMIQQQQASMQRANEQLKRVAQGQDPS